MNELSVNRIPRRSISTKESGYYPRETALTLARCRDSRETFGVHLTHQNKQWVTDAAFRLRSHSAALEGQTDPKTIRGNFGGPTDDYPGCPCCGDMVLFKCSCEKLTCFVTDYNDFEPFHCAWCGDYIDDFSDGWDSLQTQSGDLR